MAPIPTDLVRRRLLAMLAAGTIALPGSARPRAKSRTSARIVIVGTGAAGISMAARLQAQLEGVRITLIGAAQQHVYQPGLTLIAAGLWSPGDVVAPQTRWIPHGVEWIAEDAAELDPTAKVVVTGGGKRVAYDFLVVAPGLELAFDAIEGFDPKLIGQDGLGCVYAGPEAALGTYRMMVSLAEHGGDAIMTLPHTPLKCAGAPLKLTFIVDDLLRRRDVRGRARVRFRSSLSTVFGVPVVNTRVLSLWCERDIEVQYGRRLQAIDVGKRIATFASAEGEMQEHYAFLHLVPPMRAPVVVRASPLAIREGALADGGWLEVDKDTLRHKRYPDVFGCGDVNGTPRGKTAATVKKGGYVAAANLVAVVSGREPVLRFDGYTS